MSADPTDRPAAAARRRVARWWYLLLLLAPAAAGVTWLVATATPGTQRMSYGQFRLALRAGEVRTVSLGETSLSGQLTATGPDGRPRRFRSDWPGPDRDPGLVDLLERHLPRGEFDYDRGPSAATLASALAMALALGLGLWVIGRRGGFGSAMVFTRSRHREYDREGAAVRFVDVAGLEEAVDELGEVVSFLKTPERFRALGGRIPKGILLAGPPGTGKTLLARAVAGEAGVPFFSLSGSDFMELFVGVGASRVRSLFAQAEAKAPCLIFIDEVDTIGKARTGGGPGAHDERDQTLNQLLVAMDGFDSNRGILILAATNRPETLDPALTRPGRFDRHITVGRPDLAGREQILKVHARRVPLEEGTCLRQVAAMTAGFVGADLANLVNEAALAAARRGGDSVGPADFERSFERMLAGPERRHRLLRADERRRIAVHEAGHALVSRALPEADPVHKVSIVGRGGGLGGFTLYRPEDDRFLHTEGRLRAALRGLLGGTAAESIVLGEISDGAASDLQRATQLARRMVTDFGMSRLGPISYAAEGRSPFLPGGGAGVGDAACSPETAREIDLEIRRLLDEALADARALLVARRGALDSVVARLLDRETIEAADLDAALDA